MVSNDGVFKNNNYKRKVATNNMRNVCYEEWFRQNQINEAFNESIKFLSGVILKQNKTIKRMKVAYGITTSILAISAIKTKRKLDIFDLKFKKIREVGDTES